MDEVARLLRKVIARGADATSVAALHWAAIAYQPTARHWLRRIDVEAFVACAE